MHPAGTSWSQSRRATSTRRVRQPNAGARRSGYVDWHAWLRSPNVDAVCIARPRGMHADIACAAARAGEHVLARARAHPKPSNKPSNKMGGFSLSKLT